MPRPTRAARRRRQPKRTRTKRTKPKITARNADRHALYQIAVQAPEKDARFYGRYFEKVTGAPLRVFREDFCGTAALSCWFVKLHRQNHAIGVDLHGPTLAWGRRYNVRHLLDADQQRRLRLIQDDVRAVRRPRAQAIVAVNFSYSVFQTRAELAGYVRGCFAALEPGGLLFLDGWGGGLVQRACTDRRREHGFDYLWEQRSFDPISHHIDCRIHFLFRDGSRLRDAFVYDWRLWTMPELRELFTDAGFADVHVLWECTDVRRGTGNGVFRRKEVGDDDPAWISYVVGRRPAGPARARRR
jgi:SAM-dependent methyltransferase